MEGDCRTVASMMALSHRSAATPSSLAASSPAARAAASPPPTPTPMPAARLSPPPSPLLAAGLAHSSSLPSASCHGRAWLRSAAPRLAERQSTKAPLQFLLHLGRNQDVTNVSFAFLIYLHGNMLRIFLIKLIMLRIILQLKQWHGPSPWSRFPGPISLSLTQEMKRVYIMIQEHSKCRWTKS